ncbi:hypothetical protein, partial [Enterobacter mori]
IVSSLMFCTTENCDSHEKVEGLVNEKIPPRPGVAPALQRQNFGFLICFFLFIKTLALALFNRQNQEKLYFSPGGL